jgi:hypothetical protein
MRGYSWSCRYVSCVLSSGWGIRLPWLIGSQLSRSWHSSTLRRSVAFPIVCSTGCGVAAQPDSVGICMTQSAGAVQVYRED